MCNWLTYVNKSYTLSTKGKRIYVHTVNNQESNCFCQYDSLPRLINKKTAPFTKTSSLFPPNKFGCVTTFNPALSGNGQQTIPSLIASASSPWKAIIPNSDPSTPPAQTFIPSDNYNTSLAIHICLIGSQPLRSIWIKTSKRNTCFYLTHKHCRSKRHGCKTGPYCWKVSVLPRLQLQYVTKLQLYHKGSWRYLRASHTHLLYFYLTDLLSLLFDLEFWNTYVKAYFWCFYSL